MQQINGLTCSNQQQRPTCIPFKMKTVLQLRLYSMAVISYEISRPNEKLAGLLVCSGGSRGAYPAMASHPFCQWSWPPSDDT